MITETKDSIANIATIGAAGAAMVDWNSILTMALIITGIILNVIRIYEIERSLKRIRPVSETLKTCIRNYVNLYHPVTG